MYFPLLDEKPLLQVAALLRENPSYLQNAECPYSEGVKKLFGFTEANAGPAGLSKLEEEATQLFKELKDFGADLDIEDVSERMAWFRTRTSLLEKILGIHERAQGLKQVSEFQEVVLQAIEEELNADQRTRVMTKLRSALNAG